MEKTKLNSLYFLFLIFVFTNNFYCQLDEGKRITKELCSEKYFGRGYVKSGDSLASEFIAHEFEKRKIKKLKSSYFQEFQFDVNTFPGEVFLKLNDNDLKLGQDFIVDPASGSSNNEWNYKFLSKENLFIEITNGQIIREFREKREWNSLLIDTRNITGDSLKKVKIFQKEMANYCPVLSITNEKFTYSVSKEQLKYSLIYLKGDVFDKNARITSRVDAVFKKNHVSRNVIAYIPAKRKSNKYIFITAHYDHLGGIGEETFFPGGNDNASGTSMLFTLADVISKKRLKSNVVLIAFAGEEAGLLGSYYFVNNPLVPLKNIELVLNLDIMGSGEEGITVVNGTEYPNLFNKLTEINKKENYLKTINKRGKAANSDHYWFSENSVPALFVYTMGPNKNYHDIYDTYENLSFNKYESLVMLFYEFLKKI